MPNGFDVSSCDQTLSRSVVLRDDGEIVQTHSETLGNQTRRGHQNPRIRLLPTPTGQGKEHGPGRRLPLLRDQSTAGYGESPGRVKILADCVMSLYTLIQCCVSLTTICSLGPENHCLKQLRFASEEA